MKLKKLLALLLSAVLILGLLPMAALADGTLTEDINVYGSTVWLVPPEGKVVSCEAAELPEQFGTDYYPEAVCLDVTLTGVADDASFTFNMRCDDRKNNGDNIANYICSVGFTNDQKDALLDDEDEFDELYASIFESESDLYIDDKIYEIPVNLEDGATWVVLYYYTYSRRQILRGQAEFDPPVAIVLNIHKGAGSAPLELPGELENDVLTKLVPACGQLEIEYALYHKAPTTDHYTRYRTFLVVPRGVNTVDATLTFDNNDYTVTVNGVEQGPIDADNTLQVTFNAAPNVIWQIADEAVNTIRVSQGKKYKEYTLNVINQRFDDLPDRVVDFLCIGSQYTNQIGDAYGVRPVQSLVGSNFDAGGAASGPVSLGNFGGYIIYEYDEPITDNPNNPYGIDFITFGNSVEGSNEFGEVGQVWVSEDGSTWYALAGGMHYEDYADWDYSITYSDAIFEGGNVTAWTDSHGKSGTLNIVYPIPDLYPWHDFAGEEESVTLSGIYFAPEGGTNEYGNTLPPFAGFGYTDMGSRGTTLNEETGEWKTTPAGGPETEADYEAWAQNIAGNPYLSTETGENGRVFAAVTDGMDLAWAVDADGQPVDVSDMEFHYVKIVTASFIWNSGIGEKSTEVNMVRVAQAATAPVGKTAAPAKITVDGTDVPLVGGKFVYDDVPVDGPFKVAVDAPEGTNVYINNNCSASANYDGMPLHKIVRVIVQEGQKEPAIYILNLKETASAAAPSATLTLDANGGKVNGGATYTMKFDANMSGDPLPEPTIRNQNVTFGGWFMGQRRFDAIPDEIQDTTLTALWIEKEKPEQDKTISVSFRLIGSTLTENGADIDLSDGDYHGAEYVTWIPTTRYTVPEDATIADLFLLATQRAGIRSVGADKGYVSTVYAPSGYELSEFTNGPRSGWMYTMDGAHTNAINTQTMHDGAEIVFHYVNDYAWEVEDWSTLGGTGWPQQSTAQKNYWNAWMKAPDSTGSTSGSLGGGSKDKTYQITVAATENGTATASKSTASEGEKITVTAKPAEGYELDSITVKGEKAGSVEVKDGAFTMPADDVTVTVKFKEKKAETKTKQTFTDVKPEDWFYEGVEYVAEKGLMQGPGGGVFQPNETTTRAMVAQVIWNMAGKPTGNAAIPFSDVAEGAWYADAVRWAAEKGIVTGWTDESGKQVFDPDGEVTREQFAAMLYRYAKTLGKGFQGLWSFKLDFPDALDVSPWATEAMSWMVMNGVINGMDGLLNPQGVSTRAQVATMIQRLADAMEK